MKLISCYRKNTKADLDESLRPHVETTSPEVCDDETTSLDEGLLILDTTGLSQ